MIVVDVKPWLDRLPAAVRHALLLFVGSLLTWAATAVAGVEVADNPVMTGVIVSAGTSLVGTATLWFTKLTKQYGSGQIE